MLPSTTLPARPAARRPRRCRPAVRRPHRRRPAARGGPAAAGQPQGVAPPLQASRKGWPRRRRPAARGGPAVAGQPCVGPAAAGHPQGVALLYANRLARHVSELQRGGVMAVPYIVGPPLAGGLGTGNLEPGTWNREPGNLEPGNREPGTWNLGTGNLGAGVGRQSGRAANIGSA